jgi:hypothetical protein
MSAAFLLLWVGAVQECVSSRSSDRAAYARSKSSV